ncbi:MAG: T9SS type A sorting domain-containing protein [Bacteroidota bacterium]
MRKIIYYLLLSLLFLYKQGQAQTQSRMLDFNNVSAKITNQGSLFWDGVSSKFTVPKNSNKSTVFAASPWIAGTSNNQLHLMAEVYRQNGRDLIQGPVSSSNTGPFLVYWNKIWVVSKTDIQVFRSTINAGQTPDANTYKDILEWPARGNVYGKDTMNDYAPFVDVNNNNKYEPLSGDYPLIKGDISTFSMMNDNVNHTESLGLPLKVQINRMVYQYKNSTLDNTLFVDYLVTNKSINTYDSLFFSTWVDFDLGNSTDDYIATDSVRNMIYAFNGDDDDDGIMGYGTTPPAQACVVLNEPLWSSMYYSNTNSAVMGNPNTPADYYNYMKGMWMDGTPKTGSGTGHNSTGAITKFSFAGNPCEKTGWWEGGSNIEPGDRRILASITPRTLQPDESFNVTMAFVYARAESGDNIASVCALNSAVDSVKAWYKNNAGTGITEVLRKPVFTIYPNPTKQEITIDGDGIKGAELAIYNITGKKMKTITVGELTKVAVNDLPAGVYIVQLTTDRGASTQRLIVE